METSEITYVNGSGVRALSVGPKLGLETADRSGEFHCHHRVDGRSGEQGSQQDSAKAGNAAVALDFGQKLA